MVEGLILLLIAALFYLGLIYTSEALLLLATSAAVLWILGILYLLFLRFALLGKVVVPIDVTDAGKSVNVQFLIRNRFFLPVCRIKLVVEITNSFEQKTFRTRLKASRLQPGENEICYELEMEQPGNYEIRLRRICFYDFTGLLSMSKRLDSRRTLRILPELTSVPVILTTKVTNFFGESDTYDEEQSGHDNSETFQIRSYRAGDRPQSIHWKLSAKADELIVRENSLPKACPVVLLLQYSPKRHRRRSTSSDGTHSVFRKRKKPGRQESAQSRKRFWAGRRANTGNFGIFFEAAASISFSMMDAGCPHYVAWYEEKTRDITRIRVDNEESFYLFFAGFLTEQGKNGEKNLRSAYEEKYRSEGSVINLCLTDQLILYKGEQQLVKLGREGYRRQLEELELVL